MATQLLVIDGADEGRVYVLPDEGRVTLGNSRKNCDLCIHDLLAARVHCEISVSPDHIVVTDLEDSTGTYVNGQPIAQQTLQDGDVLRLGKTHLRLHATTAASAPQPSTPDKPDELPHLPSDRLTELTGHTLGHFKIGPVLGAGHHGVVFRAQDFKHDQVVALKVLSPDFPKSDAEMQRFVKVLKPFLPLRHPHLVGVTGAGKNGPYCWVSLEYVEGESLTNLLRRQGEHRRIDWQRAYRITVHVARALEFAHQHHIMHKNITPQNIVVQTGGKLAKLGDFFLGPALEGSALQLAKLENKFLAELPYLSPEQTDPDAFVD